MHFKEEVVHDTFNLQGHVQPGLLRMDKFDLGLCFAGDVTFIINDRLTSRVQNVDFDPNDFLLVKVSLLEPLDELFDEFVFSDHFEGVLFLFLIRWVDEVIDCIVLHPHSSL